ncbi:hypothetical protein AB1Y20_013716 [Prymnesium parvum]|uniref:Uncharacterized protein n=1 Tax=Prymnesium parvum TaxID=97485 RepID=A0AB34IHE6_PRYPA|mmetsp:Transcript_32206/g.80213  ORF Transcript_32206/g.80213 Transcript_32206/m.80213 type:complete len:323 (-) Transcript_32206:638-1606(-)
MSLSWLLRSSRILKRLLFGKAEPCTLKAAAWTLAAAFSVCAGWKALSPSTRQEHHKPVVAVLTSHGLSVVGHDYPCEDSDGPDRRACQIQCSSPCIEPYRLCLAHLECGAIAVNPALSFATLKRTLPASAESFVRIIHSKREWREWLANATLTRGGKLRRVHVALHPLAGGGHDFPCPDSEGADVKACQLSCSSSSECRSAYDHCINHAPCAVIELNAPLFTWATLKAGPVNRSDTLEIADGASWHATFQKITEANREHPASPTNSAAVAHLWVRIVIVFRLIHWFYISEDGRSCAGTRHICSPRGMEQGIRTNGALASSSK